LLAIVTSGRRYHDDYLQGSAVIHAAVYVTVVVTGTAK
jgi:hypothetical protein